MVYLGRKHDFALERMIFMKKYRLGCIGAGNMGGAILQGAVHCGYAAASDIAVFDMSEEKRQECRGKGYATLNSAREVYESCTQLLLAVKPQGCPAVLEDLGPCQSRPDTVISIVTGFTTARLHDALGVKIVRVMPNTPLLLGVGATALCPGEGVGESELKAVIDLFASMGEAAVIPEDKLNEVIPVNGSSPAFVYYYIDVLARWAQEQGVDYPTALRLTAKTFEGAARMVLKGDDDPQTLIRKVCSPGGATLEGMAALEKGGADKTLRAAADACVKRAYELGK